MTDIDPGALAQASNRHYSDDDGPLAFYGGPFSNFAPIHREIAAPQAFTDDASGELYERRYRTTEHFYQASKAQTQHQHDLVANEGNTWAAKRLGQQVVLREDWDRWASVYYMLVALRHKFRDSDYRADLLATGGRYLFEDSPTDKIWGLRTPGDPFTAEGWRGRNLLGISLMVVRSELRGEKPVYQADVPMQYATSAEDIARFMRALGKPWYATWEGEWRNRG